MSTEISNRPRQSSNPETPADNTEFVTEHSCDDIQEYDNPLPGWWKFLLWISILFAPIYYLYFHSGVAGRSIHDQYNLQMASIFELRFSEIGELSPDRETILKYMNDEPKWLAVGKVVYQTHCVSCHAANGGGLVGPNLTDDYWKNVRSIEEIAQVIEKGAANGSMPAWKHRLSRGKWLAWRRVLAWLLIAVFTLLPFVRVAGKPFVLLDIAARRFTIFGFTFLPTDTVLLAIFLVGVLVSIYLANTFLAYFVGVDRLGRWLTQSPLEHPVPFTVMALVTFAMMFDFCFFREQMCLIACPYGRLQSVLLDQNSLIVAYQLHAMHRCLQSGDGQDWTCARFDPLQFPSERYWQALGTGAGQNSDLPGHTVTDRHGFPCHLSFQQNIRCRPSARTWQSAFDNRSRAGAKPVAAQAHEPNR